MVLTGNSAQNGAAIYMEKCNKVRLRNTGLVKNTASKVGAIVVDEGEDVEFDFSSQNITGNNAENGGVLVAYNVKGLQIRGGIFDSNGASNNGAVFFLHSVNGFAVNGSRFKNNTGKKSGAIYVVNPEYFLVFNDIIMDNNKASGIDGCGGAITIKNGVKLTSLRLSNSSFTNNYAGMNGGALFGDGFKFDNAYSDFYITNTLFQGNDAGEYGGALALDLTSLNKNNRVMASNDYAKVVIGKGTQFFKNQSAKNGGGGSIAVQFDPNAKPVVPRLVFSKVFPKDVKENTAGNGKDGNEIRITARSLSTTDTQDPLRADTDPPTFKDWTKFIYLGYSGISPVPKSVYSN